VLLSSQFLVAASQTAVPENEKINQKYDLNIFEPLQPLSAFCHDQELSVVLVLELQSKY
jgi:hypothetical protein